MTGFPVLKLHKATRKTDANESSVKHRTTQYYNTNVSVYLCYITKMHKYNIQCHKPRNRQKHVKSGNKIKLKGSTMQMG